MIKFWYTMLESFMMELCFFLFFLDLLKVDEDNLIAYVLLKASSMQYILACM